MKSSQEYDHIFSPTWKALTSTVGEINNTDQEKNIGKTKNLVSCVVGKIIDIRKNRTITNWLKKMEEHVDSVPIETEKFIDERLFSYSDEDLENLILLKYMKNVRLYEQIAIYLEYSDRVKQKEIQLLFERLSNINWKLTPLEYSPNEISNY